MLDVHHIQLEDVLPELLLLEVVVQVDVFLEVEFVLRALEQIEELLVLLEWTVVRAIEDHQPIIECIEETEFLAQILDQI